MRGHQQRIGTNRLSANAGYISMAEAIKRAQAEGASGDVLKIDLEWDDARLTVTWDVTFSSGAEYEVDAISDTVFEVLLADGATLFYDAATGKPLTGL